MCAVWYVYVVYVCCVVLYVCVWCMCMCVLCVCVLCGMCTYVCVWFMYTCVGCVFCVCVCVFASLRDYVEVIKGYHVTSIILHLLLRGRVSPRTWNLEFL